MEKLVETLRSFKRELVTLDIKGSLYQARLKEELIATIDKLREDVESDLELERPSIDWMTSEVAQAVEEVVQTTGRSYSDVMEGAKQVYMRQKQEIDKKESFRDMFKGW